MFSRIAVVFLGVLLVFPLGNTTSIAQKKGKDKGDKGAISINLSEKIKNSQSMIKEMHSIYRAVMKRLQEAKRRQDLVALDCLREKLLRIKALLFTAEKARAQLMLQGAGKSREDLIRIDTSYSTIVRSHRKVKDLKIESEQCRGRAGIYEGEGTQIEFETPPHVTSTDPTVVPWREPVLYRPIDASYWW